MVLGKDWLSENNWVLVNDDHVLPMTKKEGLTPGEKLLGLAELARMAAAEQAIQQPQVDTTIKMLATDGAARKVRLVVLQIIRSVPIYFGHSPTIHIIVRKFGYINIGK
jgi:hypothetical protein